MRRRIAGILDCHGGLRVVVGAEESIYANCSIVSPERLFLMPPDCWVDTDETDHIPWNMIPWTVRRVELYIEWWCRTRNDPDNLRHIAIERWLPRFASKSRDGTGGEHSQHIAGLLPPPRAAVSWP